MSTSSDRIIEVFSQAKARAPGAERERFLAEACQGDAELRKQVESILQADAAASDFLQKTQVPPAPTVATEKPGDRIGHYKLLERIGEGGMGTVWMAEQTEPVRRRVALKVIKQGMDSGQVLARFEAERQALALMDHPNIAKIFDAGVMGGPLTPSLSPIGGEGARRAGEGVAPSLSPIGGEGRGEGAPPPAVAPGRSYFVMELVKGIPITKFCDEQRLSIRERLDLFIPVCQAIQHAHQKGIIHRDIKPSNVLVALYDGKPVPKVIDFGVAKAIGQPLTERTLFTSFGAVVGTLEYMPPEQAEWNQLDVDTRSDIYSLGVLLYELLTGTTPLTRETLRQAAFYEVLRRIREEEPPRPSTRLSQSKERLVIISAQRKLDPARLTKLVRGDLDWIVMKCLEKDRTRRYETANGLAADLQRHLNNEPVLASPPGKLYRLQKTMRRHKLAFAAAGAVLASLVIGLGTATVMFFKERATGADLVRKNTELEQKKREVEINKAEVERKNTQLELQKAEVERKNTELEVKKTEVEVKKAEVERKSNEYRAMLAEAARSDRVVAEAQLRAGQEQEAFAHLARACEYDPSSKLAAEKGIAALNVWDHISPTLILAGHKGNLVGVHFSPDGTRIVSASDDNTARVWDAAAGNTVMTLAGHSNRVRSAQFSANGARIVTASDDGNARVWDAASGKLLATLTGKIGGGCHERSSAGTAHASSRRSAWPQRCGTQVMASC